MQFCAWSSTCRMSPFSQSFARTLEGGSVARLGDRPALLGHALVRSAPEGVGRHADGHLEGEEGLI
eukprot:7555135-Alexandrium_andersonii.AAC.1